MLRKCSPQYTVAIMTKFAKFTMKDLRSLSVVYGDGFNLLSFVLLFFAYPLSFASHYNGSQVKLKIYFFLRNMPGAECHLPYCFGSAFKAGGLWIAKTSAKLSPPVSYAIRIHNAILREGASCLLFFREPYTELCIGVTIRIQRAFDDFRSVCRVYYISAVIIRIFIE